MVEEISPPKPMNARISGHKKGPNWGRVNNASEGVSTGVWCVPGFGAGFEFALEPSKLQKEGENPGKGHF